MAFSSKTVSSQTIGVESTYLFEINNSNTQMLAIPFFNDSDQPRQIAVFKSENNPLPGVSDSVGFFSVESPYPGEPETIMVEPYDSARVFVQINPNGSIGNHVIDVCFYDYGSQNDTVCTTVEIEMDETLAYVDGETFDFFIFPNPLVEVLTIESTKSIQSVEIYGSNGSLVEIHDLDSFNAEFSISGLKPGYYFVSCIFVDEVRKTKQLFIGNE